MLQLGHWPETSAFLEQCRVNHCLLASPRAPADLLCRLQALPVESGSMEVVFMPHTLAFCDDPHGVIREAERVLAPGGHLLLLGFSPYSFWGLRALLRRAPFADRTELLAERRIGDWMALMGLELLTLERYLYRPPLNIDLLLRRGRWLEHWGHSMIPGPWPSAAYAALLQKRDLAGNVIRPRWEQRRNLGPAAVPDSFQGGARSRRL
nr:methyltransferase domain-containing protein [Natronospira proteinivora]